MDRKNSISSTLARSHNISVVRRTSRLDENKTKQEQALPDQGYEVVKRKWWGYRENQIFVLEVCKFILMACSLGLFVHYFYGEFPAPDKVIDDMSLNEATIREWDVQLEKSLIVLYGLSLAFIMSLSVTCHVYSLYMPEPKETKKTGLSLMDLCMCRGQKKNKLQRRANEDFETNENLYKISRREWQKYMIEQSLANKFGLLPHEVLTDESYDWGITIDEEEHNMSKWGRFYKWWTKLKRYTTASHWLLLLFDFFVGIVVVLVVFDFNVPSYEKQAIKNLITEKEDWKFNISAGSRNIEYAVVLTHAFALVAQMMITLFHIKPSIARIIPNFYFSDQIIQRRKDRKKNDDVGCFDKLKAKLCCMKKDDVDRSRT